jgi:hypothetical protein
MERRLRARKAVRRVEYPSRRSASSGCTDAEVECKLGGESHERLRARGLVVGTSSEIVEQLGSLAEAGVQRVML